MLSRTTRIILGVIGFVLILVVVAVGGALYLFFSAAREVADQLSDDTTASARPTTANGRVEFAMTYGREVVNLSRFTVLEAQGNQLWQLECRNSRKPPLVVYGELPTDAPRGYVQLFPADGAKPTDIRGTKVRVKIEVRYIIAMGAGHQIYESEFDIAKGP